jgi:hypothetical protein
MYLKRGYNSGRKGKGARTICQFVTPEIFKHPTFAKVSKSRKNLNPLKVCPKSNTDAKKVSCKYSISFLPKIPISGKTAGFKINKHPHLQG